MQTHGLTTSESCTMKKTPPPSFNLLARTKEQEAAALTRQQEKQESIELEANSMPSSPKAPLDSPLATEDDTDTANPGIEVGIGSQFVSSESVVRPGAVAVPSFRSRSSSEAAESWEGAESITVAVERNDSAPVLQATLVDLEREDRERQERLIAGIPKAQIREEPRSRSRLWFCVAVTFLIVLAAIILSVQLTNRSGSEGSLPPGVSPSPSPTLVCSIHSISGLNEKNHGNDLVLLHLWSMNILSYSPVTTTKCNFTATQQSGSCRYG